MNPTLAEPRTASEVLDHVWENRSAVPARDAYTMTLLALARSNPSIACLSIDMDLQDHFSGELHRQFVDLGIAEQNTIGVAAGMTVSADQVFANGMSPFTIARAFEQIKIDVAGADLPIKIVATHAGLASGHYGPTHHSLEDIGAVRMLPNMAVVAPIDAYQTAQATAALARTPGPAYLRLGKQGTPSPFERRPEFELGRAQWLRDPGRVVFIATAPRPNLVAAEAARELGERGITAGHLNMHTVKPLDREAVREAAAHAEVVVTIEDHRAVGGLGGAVCEATAETGGPPVKRIGVPDVHYDLVGDEGHLLDRAGINADNAVARALEVVS
ncbi:transketolase family protein [Glycomyces xiaoerkulensis]|uniref:transketolase family protein n=1 Tax=Glycomyces xiaoerkulensis TaxID=2038139 RepID=UPI000C25EE5C|nr:transketolase C-terminal domain-containing protein [Glycomyces xiaoerkulensis]